MIKRHCRLDVSGEVAILAHALWVVAMFSFSAGRLTCLNVAYFQLRVKFTNRDVHSPEML